MDIENLHFEFKNRDFDLKRKEERGRGTGERDQKLTKLYYLANDDFEAPLSRG